ncbi:MAG: hypothetical protein GFH27_549285n93 [Chloroflexi bacterium AL-W]|nr:hypothetical protein [Chloroflexi bacterium AL-N1]NOK65605.1 hypothetical protein [Chloroflexi bacterium AL-N10]NOK74454.1 hypothetical protein [Chloroflexi bacterium AL-N5]NOK80638.1 hypothetical protein [Chloroflexi bacterium AL-W]NOK88712.1 hypothetical protein [Chloroflexi bacterium AL-N15]
MCLGPWWGGPAAGVPTSGLWHRCAQSSAGWSGDGPHTSSQLSLRHVGGMQLLDAYALAVGQRRVGMLVHHRSCGNGYPHPP